MVERGVTNASRPLNSQNDLLMTKVNIACGLFVEVVWVLSVSSTDGTVGSARLLVLVILD